MFGLASLFTAIFLLVAYGAFVLLHWIGLVPAHSAFGWLVLLVSAVATAVAYKKCRRQVTAVNFDRAWLPLLLLLVIGIASSALMPHPPVFNIHAFNTLDIGRLLTSEFRMPLFEVAVVAPSALFPIVYPSDFLQGLMLRYLSPLLPGVQSYLIGAGILSFLLSLLAVTALAWWPGKLPRRTHLATMVALFIFAIPPLFEAFSKYPGSDAFTIWAAMLGFVLSFAAYRRQWYWPFILWACFSSIIRVYLGLTLFVYFVLLLALGWWLRRSAVVHFAQHFFARRNFAKYLLFLLLALSWRLVLYQTYGVPVEDLSKIGFDGQSITEEQALSRDYKLAALPAQMRGESSWQELKNSIFSDSIYYKTFTTVAPPSIWQVLFSTKVFVLLTLGLLLWGLWQWVGRKTAYREEIFFATTWAVATVVVWLLLLNSGYPIIKLALNTIPVLAFVLALLLSEQSEKTGKIRWLVLWQWLWLAFFFANNLLIPLQQRQALALPAHQADFNFKYGPKHQSIAVLAKLGFEPSQVLWVVRGEHGGMTPYYWQPPVPLWDYVWYDSPRYHALHIASTAEQVHAELKNFDLRVVVAMRPEKLRSFFVEGYRGRMGYPEKLMDMLQDGSPYLQKVSEEPPTNGLELAIYRVAL